MPDLIGRSIDRYHIRAQLGEGGMATVYQAYDTRLERDVAVKVIRRDAFPAEQHGRLLARFDREAKALAKLSHPNIVKVLDYGEHEGSPYLVLEFIPGGTLKTRLGKPMPWREAVRLLRPVAGALQFAHEQGIIHRDVKPANILLTLSGEPMLSDFGIAKVLASQESVQLTSTGTGVGTPAYMAPEQGLGQDVDGRADIYALGTVLYEMISGRVPYRADTPPAVLLKKMSDPLPPLRGFVPGVPEAVEKFLLRTLAKNPENRLATMAEFSGGLEKLLAVGAPVATALGADATFDVLTGVRVPETKTVKRLTGPWRWLLPVGGVVLALLAICVVAGILLLSQNDLFGRGQEEPTIVPGGSNQAQMPSPNPGTSATATESVKLAAIGPQDGAELLLVPAGEFIMGANSDEPYFWGMETPRHLVRLDAFLIYRTEVTNAMYRACVAAGECEPPVEERSSMRDKYYNDPDYGEYPVIYVTYRNATDYCAWAGGRLPTEAEWEKAARGADGALFPWGSDELRAEYANFCDNGCYNPDPAEIESGFEDGYTDTAPVGSYPAGASPYGALDMAGNVLEWVYDLMGTYNVTGEASNPTGPTQGTRTVVRGGSWFSGREGLRGAARASFTPDASFDNLGFRCAADAP